MSGWEPDRAWIDARFDQAVRPTLFAGREPEGRPVAVLLGGQPGAGKSRAAQFARELYDHPLVVVNGDDFRALHPDFKRLQRDDPEQMPRVTQAVSAPLVERSIDYAKEHRVSMLVEGTFRDSAVALRTAAALSEAGFKVHAVALAVPPAVSYASTLGRFYETQGTDQSRWTPREAHDVAVAGMPSTVEALGQSADVARVSVLDRDGRVLSDDTRPGPQRARAARAVVEEEHARPLTVAERQLVSSIHAKGAESAVRVASAAFPTPPTQTLREGEPHGLAGPRRRPPCMSHERAPGIGD